jgi:hypothetical protein
MKQIIYGDVVKLKETRPDGIALITHIGETSVGAGIISSIGQEHEEVAVEAIYSPEDIAEVIERWPFARIVNAATNYWAHGASPDQRQKLYHDIYALHAYNADRSATIELEI